MKKEKVKAIIEKSPMPKAHTAEKHEIPVTVELGYGIGILLMIFGAVCVLWTDHLYKVFPWLLGALMMALGIIDILRGCATKEYKKRETKLTSNGIVFLVLGIVVFAFGTESYKIIGAIWGTLGLIKGSEELNKAIYCIAHREAFIRELTSAVVELGLGILLLLEPVGNLHHHIVILGFELIVYGWRYIRKIKKARSVEEEICEKRQVKN